MNQKELDKVREYLIAEGERLMDKRDLQVHESPEFWSLHDAAWNLFDASENLLRHKIRRTPIQ